MRLALKLVLLALGVLVVAWLVFSWFEADTEIRVLCSEFHPGMEREHVIHILDTGEHLRYRSNGGPDDPIRVDSLYNLRSTRCTIEFEDSRVVVATYQ